MKENLWKTLTQRYKLEKSSHSAEGIPFLERKAMQADQYTQIENTEGVESDQVSKQLHVDLSVTGEPQDKNLWEFLAGSLLEVQ